MTFWFRMGIVLAHILIRPFFWVRYRGRKNIPKTGKMILCANHISVMDPIFIMMAMGDRRKVRFMAKSELFQNKFAGALLRWLGAFPVVRGTPDTVSLRTAIGILDAGQPLGIFPEGGCVYEPVPFKPKAGATLLAAKTGASILPVALSCKGRVRIFKRVEVHFGPLIPYEALGFSEGTLREARQAGRLVAERVNAIMGARQ